MVGSRALLWVAAAGFVTGCVPVPPRVAERAEEECRAEARAEGFRQIETEASEVGFGDTVVVRMRARRGDREYRGTCTWDRDKRRARLDLERVEDRDDRFEARAREACREEAVDRGYEVRGTSDARRIGDSFRLTLDLRRRGRSYEGYCRYEDGEARLEIR
ncbi:MAG: hypothetical protein N2038_03200 [Geminicoccaceae bacterium]|nr:hypothetical protein [Geminicoccaceae bacterium]MCX7629236.1 hypothetical protein [Geminicoccaceae bacterium]MDW8124599.1 hypothetical protein [Geminicoccaceae bacterium]MDW8341467.1 hypothetical protein [Geminicoccaceae bacterium]